MTRSPQPTPGRSGLRGPSFALQLFVLLAVPIGLLALAVPFASLTLPARAMRELVGERDRGAASAAATGLSEQLHHRAATVRSLALYAALAPAPDAALSAFTFQQVAFDGGLALFSRDGVLLSATNNPTDWQA